MLPNLLIPKDVKIEMFVYGPIPSRRLGRSLGVNLLPKKTCTYSCIYCQLGRTNHLQLKRKSFYPKEEILNNILHSYPNSIPDYITFVGDGEPTLYRHLGWLIRNVKRRLNARVAIITNGSLLYRKDVRQDLEMADVVIPSIDAGDERLFNVINRPHPGIDFSTVINGISEFRHNYSGKLWIEVMLLRGLNDTEPELMKIKNIITKIKPDRVYLLTPIRPPAEKLVNPPDHRNIKIARELLVESIPIVEYESNEFDLQNYHDAGQAILDIGRHHPLRSRQIDNIAAHFCQSNILNQLIQTGQLTLIHHNSMDYFIPKNKLAGK